MPTDRRLKICIASSDIVGPIRNGGIGTWHHALALALAQAGHDVTILYLLGQHCENQTIDRWVAYYAEKNVTFVPLHRLPLYTCDSQIWIRVSLEAYIWLRDREFDLIHFHEWRAHGFYSLLAKKQGLAFANTKLIVATHSPTLWHKFGMAEYISEIEDLHVDHMERTSVALADIVVSPSRYMIRWIEDHGWTVPGAADYLQYIQHPFLSPAELESAGHRAISELVFFGRLETRKGLALFCDAIARLKLPETLSITFMGKRVWMNGQESGQYLKQETRNWPVRWKIVDNLDHAGAIAYLQQPGRLAVICSLLDNSPNTVLECLSNGIPCLTTDVGGIPELVAEADRPRVLFPPRVDALVEKLQQVLRDGIVPAKPAIHPEITRQQWLDWHQRIAAPADASQSPPRPADLKPAAPVDPRISVILVTRNRPRFLAQAVESLRAQDYSNFEVILVDDGSTDPAALAALDSYQSDFGARGWKIVRQPNQYLGAARNNGARRSQGKWLLFMDDDNLAKPNELSTFVHAARSSGADILTCLTDVFIGDEAPRDSGSLVRRWLPLGGSLAVGAFTNLFGDANGLIRRDVFQALGGFTEDYGVGHEDWELYARAALRGYRIMVVPEALLWYRVLNTSMLRTTSHFANHMRSLRPYLQHVGPELAGILEFAQGLFFSPKSGEERSRLKTAEINGDPVAYQRLVDEYWDSWSWRLSAPVRNTLMRLRGRQPQTKPLIRTQRDALHVVNDIRDSVSWEATAFLRIVGRAFKFKDRRRK